MVIYADTCVFWSSILVSVEPQKCSVVWYTLKYHAAHNSMLHSQPLNFILVSLFLEEHTWHLILLHCTSQWLLCLVSSLFSWLIDGACLPCFLVKMLSMEGPLLMWGGSDCCNPLGPPANLWTTGTESQQFVLSGHCMKFVSVTSPTSLSVTTGGKNYFN